MMIEIERSVVERVASFAVEELVSNMSEVKRLAQQLGIRGKNKTSYNLWQSGFLGGEVRDVTNDIVRVVRQNRNARDGSLNALISISYMNLLEKKTWLRVLPVGTKCTASTMPSPVSPAASLMNWNEEDAIVLYSSAACVHHSIDDDGASKAADADADVCPPEGEGGPKRKRTAPEANASPDESAPPDVDAEFCPPEGEGGTKRKRKASGAMRAAKRASMHAAEEDAGYVDRGRVEFRSGDEVLVTGGERTCLPDVLYVLMRSLGVRVELDDVRSITPNATKNTRFQLADEYVQRFGLRLERVTKQFMVKGGPALKLFNTKGLYMVQLRVAYDKEDKEPDLHCVAYDGQYVKDNNRYSKVKEIEDLDRSSRESARAVFDSLFKGLQVRINNVYELKRI